MEMYNWQSGAQIRRNWSLCVQNISALSRGIRKKNRGYESIHFSGDSTNTQNSCSTPCNSSAQYSRSSSELVSSVRLDRGREGKNQFICGHFWHLYHLMKYNFWHLFRQMHQKNNSQENIQSSKVESSRIHFPKLCEDDHFEHRVSAWLRFKIRLDGDDGCGAIVHPVGSTHFLEHIFFPEFVEQFFGEHLLDRSLKFETWKLLKNLCLKDSFLSKPTFHQGKVCQHMCPRWSGRWFGIMIKNANETDHFIWDYLSSVLLMAFAQEGAEDFSDNG